MKTEDLPVSKQLNSFEDGVVVSGRPMLIVSLSFFFFFFNIFIGA